MTDNFPHFKSIEIQDREFIHPIIQAYQPETSEWTFTNLYAYRRRHSYQWSKLEDNVVVIGNDNSGIPYGLHPLGLRKRSGTVLKVLHWLRDTHGEKAARIERADYRTVMELAGTTAVIIEEDRDNHDYIYRSKDLIELSGGKYHSKRNHLKRFNRNYDFTFEELTDQDAAACLHLTDNWCRMRNCMDDINLTDEWEIVCEMLLHREKFGLKGAVITIDGAIQAFTLGELLNETTAVIHVEKANPDYNGIYPAINQNFCELAWNDVPYINREQDLGEPGLRKAKESYHPVRMSKKYRIRLVD